VSGFSRTLLAIAISTVAIAAQIRPKQRAAVPLTPTSEPMYE
jgi:hypothetical protein